MTLREAWTLDPTVRFLNHGSFGATPRAVLAHQAELRARMERNPMDFFVRQWEPLHDAAREALGAFLGADPARLAAVPNATAAVNAVLARVALAPGDELLTTDHEYNACANVLREAAARSGARVVVARVPFPLRDAGEVTAAVLDAVTPRTRLALVDHVTSQTGVVFPVEDIARGLAARGVAVMIDGAHAPGMLPLAVESIGCDWYTGNLHKWVCAPKGAAFLWARDGATRPLVVSHGANATRVDRSRFRLEWDWTGTCDPTAFLSAPVAVRVMGDLLDGAWDALRARNHALVLRARDLLCDALGVRAPAPDAMLGAMASVPLPDDLPRGAATADTAWCDPLQHRLWTDHRIEVPVIPWPDATRRLVRVSAQAYNTLDEYAALADALVAMRG